MRQMCEEAKDVGMKTMSALENQGETIDRWEEVVDGINQVIISRWVIIIFMSGACSGNVQRRGGGGFCYNLKLVKVEEILKPKLT